MGARVVLAVTDVQRDTLLRLACGDSVRDAVRAFEGLRAKGLVRGFPYYNQAAELTEAGHALVGYFEAIARS